MKEGWVTIDLRLPAVEAAFMEDAGDEGVGALLLVELLRHAADAPCDANEEARFASLIRSHLLEDDVRELVAIKRELRSTLSLYGRAPCRPIIKKPGRSDTGTTTKGKSDERSKSAR